MDTRIKALGADRVGGYLVVWGDAGQRDLHGEYFTPETELGLDWYDRRPVLYQHGLDGDLKAAVIGALDVLRADAVGVWAEAQLDLRARYVQAVRRLVDQGVLSWSSGSLPHLVEVAADGHIRRWPIVEGSLTPTPAEPRRTDVGVVKSAYAALGLDTARLAIDETKRIDDEEDAVSEQAMTTPARKRLPVASAADALPQITVGSPYDSLDAMDLLHGYMLLRSGKHFRGVSAGYAAALAEKVGRAQLTGIKADELAHTAQHDYGAEWVPELWSAQIWQRARLENAILPLFQAVEMPSNPFELPVEGTDPTVYYVSETKHESQLALDGAAIPDSRIGTAKATLEAKKLALRVGFSAELVEDAIVPVLNIYREQAMRAITSTIDQVLLNGDTTDNSGAAKNINQNGGALTGTESFLAFDGLRKLALVTNAEAEPNRVDSGATALDLAKLRATRFRMASRYAARPSDLAWIVDGGTYARMLGLGEFLTMDKAGALATAQTGQIGYADGVPVIVSAEMPLTAADGLVSTTSGDNVRGTALCVYRPGWFVGYRRRIAVSVDYLPYYDSYQLTATVRLAFVHVDGAAADVASARYNSAAARRAGPLPPRPHPVGGGWRARAGRVSRWRWMR